MNKEAGFAAEQLCGLHERSQRSPYLVKPQLLSLPFEKDIHAWKAEEI